MHFRVHVEEEQVFAAPQLRSQVVAGAEARVLLPRIHEEAAEALPVLRFHFFKAGDGIIGARIVVEDQRELPEVVVGGRDALNTLPDPFGGIISHEKDVEFHGVVLSAKSELIL